MSRVEMLDRLGIRCTSYKRRGGRCTRWGRCWSQRSGRHCLQHMQKLEPGAFWY